MKTFLVIIITLFSASLLQAQKPCTGKKYAYAYAALYPPPKIGCHLVYHCAENPNGEFSPDAVIRWPSGSTIQYATNDMSQPQGCVDVTSLNQCIKDAFCLWTNLCDDNMVADKVPYDITNENIVPIRFQGLNNDVYAGSGSSATHEFGDTRIVRAGTVARTHVEPDCGGSITPRSPANHSSLQYATFIDINGLYDYTSAHVDVCPCSSKNSCPYNGKVDLCKALTHEIGHLFGIQHTLPSPDEQNQTPPLLDCTTGNPDPKPDPKHDLMYYSLGNQPCDGTPVTLSQNDQCEYMKLYCYADAGIARSKRFRPLDASCSQSGVDEGTLVPTFDPSLVAYPNPTTGQLTVQYTSNLTGTVSLRIFSIIGEQVLLANYRVSPGTQSYTLDLSKLPSGHYIVRIAGVDLRGSKMVELTR